jgi:hypothetical protein
MPTELTEALRKRAQQWEVFHEWERNRADTPIPLEERIAWYASAFACVQGLPSPASNKDRYEKARQIGDIHSRLRHLRRRDV